MNETQKCDFEKAIRDVKKFCEVRDWDQFHSAKDLAIGLTTESAELLDLFRFKSDLEIEERLKETGFREKTSDELADVFFFILRFAEKNGFNLTESLQKKLAKNEIKYPVSTSKGSNRKYNE